MTLTFKIFAASICILAPQVQAHEFWIDAEDYTVPSGDPVSARFVNGENLAGSALSWIPNRSVRFDMVVEDEVREVPARIGDNPAFSVADLPDGLLTILHETTDRSLIYSEWAKWVKFTDHKALQSAQQGHLDRGLPQELFSESFRRFAKALIAVGDGAGQDADRGLLIEIVAEANPYTADVSGGLPVQVLYRGAPRAEAQIEMFEKDAAGEVAITLHTTDAEGRAVVPVLPGHTYLLDSVAIEPLEPEKVGDPVWQTNWAALTFAVPEG